jgi:hypothetical protein
MSFPPRGYDDETVVPQQRLKVMLNRLESELDKVQMVFHQHLPGQFHMPDRLDKEFWSLRASAEELGTEYTFLVEKLISDYERFRETPDQDKLDKIFNDVKSLQLLLVG